MKLTKTKLKQIIKEELKEGWNPFSSDKDDPIGNLKSMLKDSKKLLNDLESDKLTVGMAAMTADNQRDKTSKLQQKVLEKGDSRQIEKMKKIVDMIMKLHRVVFDRDEAEQRSSEDRRQPAYGIEPTWGGGLTQAGPIRESNMKLTKSKLKQIIKEEVKKMFEAGYSTGGLRYGPEEGRNIVVHTQEPQKGEGRVLAIGPQGVLVMWEDGTQQLADPGVIMTVQDAAYKQEKMSQF